MPADRRLHIGIDGRELVGRPTGVGRYLSEILRVWRNDTLPHLPHRLTLFVPVRLHEDSSHETNRVETVVIPSDRAGTSWEQFALPGALRRAGVDVLLAPGYTAPIFAPCPTVPMIHDVSFCAHPEWFSVRERVRRSLFTRATARRARAILTISAFSRDEIVKYLGVPASRITIAAPGAPKAAVSSEDGLRDPLVLYVGSLFTRRHIPDLLAGFAAALRRVPEARLVLVGDDRAMPPVDPMSVARGLGISDRVEWRQYASDGEIEDLYQRAKAFAFLSDYEGFAMTPLEALAHGVPAVLLDTAVAREVYGDAVALVTAAPDAIAAALVPLLSNADAHKAAVSRGAECVARYSWRASAAIILRVLERAAGSEAKIYMKGDA